MTAIEFIVRGVIVEDDKFLLCRGKGRSNYFFPGGHIEIGEGASEALIREIREELGEDSEVKRFMGASENKFIKKGGEIHEINLVYEVVLPSHGKKVSRENHLEFEWLTRDELQDTTVFPKSLKGAILTTNAKDSQFWVSEGFDTK